MPKRSLPSLLIATPSTPAERGAALRAWLKRKKLTITDFAEAAGIGRATLNRYLSGLKDVATVEQEIADQMLRAMGISDGEAWELLGIPDAHRHTFRSFRPPPLGHGALLREDLEVRLDQPLFGSVALPAGTQIRVSRDGPRMEHQVYRMTDGRLFAATNGMTVDGEHLGGLISAHFAIGQ